MLEVKITIIRKELGANDAQAFESCYSTKIFTDWEEAEKFFQMEYERMMEIYKD